MVAGGLSAPDSTLVQACAFVGTLFLNALSWWVVPLIVGSLIHRAARPCPTRTAVALGLRRDRLLHLHLPDGGAHRALDDNLLNPGIIDGAPAGHLLGLAKADPELLGASPTRAGATCSTCSRMIRRTSSTPPPRRHPSADLLQLLIRLFRRPACDSMLRTQREFCGPREVMLGITGFVMRFAPIGVFALVTKTFASTGLAASSRWRCSSSRCLLGLAIADVRDLPLTLKLIARVSPWRHLRAMPRRCDRVLQQQLRGDAAGDDGLPANRAGAVLARTSFVLPLGATINLDGSAALRMRRRDVPRAGYG